MWLRIRQGIDSLIRLFNQLQISVKITLVYAVLMAVLLTLTSACTIIGLYYTQYHQVERELTVCSQAILRQLAQNYGYRVGYVDGRPDMYVDIGISYGMLGFIGSVIIAKYLGGNKL